jgi:apolipoprotein N-acyltransferase
MTTAPLRAVLAVGSGLALAASFEPYDLPLLLPAGIAGFALALHGVRPRRGAWLGLLTGAAFMYVHLFWMRSVGYDAWVLLGTLETVFFAPLGAAVAAVSRLKGWPVWTAALWVSVEVWRSSYPFGGMPWGRLAFATADTPFASALPYVGAIGVSLLVALIGTTLAWAVLRFRDSPRAVAAAALGLGAAVLLPVLAPYTTTPDGQITVAAVQGDVPGPGTDILYDHRQVTRNHVDTTIRLAADAEAGEVPAPDLVLWPENATALDPFRDAPLNSQIREAVAAVNVPILVGAIVDDPRPGKILNQGIVWNPVTGAADRYTKRHPVPYGEYIPWRDSNPLTSRFDELARVARDMQAGTRVDPLMISGVPVADAICFDVAYDEGIYAQLRAGARLLVVQTSNATFSRTSQLDQQFDITRVRAIETGRHVAVASTNGLTGIISPDGTPTSVLDRWTQGYVVEQVPLTSDVPPAMRIGPALGLVCFIVGVCALAATLLPYRRTSARAPAERVMASSTADRPPTDEDHS